VPEEKRSLKVFLCHASADKPKVRELYRYLKRRGIKPWFDEVDLVGGQDWQAEIPKALSTSDATIICLTKDSVDKEGYVQKEIKFALDKALEMPEGRIFLIPVRLEDCDLPYSLKKYQWVDLFEEGGYPKLMRALKVRASQLQRVNIELPYKVDQLPKSERSDDERAEPEEKSFDIPKAESRSRKFDIAIIVALISLVGTIIAVLLSSPILTTLVSRTLEPTIISLSTTPHPSTTVLSQTPISASSHVIDITLPSATNSPRPPTLTLTPKPGYVIVDPQEVLNIAPSLRTLGQLAIEKYSIEDRNRINNMLTFTIESTPDVPILWRWFWCAVNDKVLEQNMTKISIIFDADGRVILEDQLAKVIFENSDPTYEGWKCLTYETVLRGWKPGTYKLIQTMTIASAINDGAKTFEAGYKIYDYTVNISP